MKEQQARKSSKVHEGVNAEEVRLQALDDGDPQRVADGQEPAVHQLGIGRSRTESCLFSQFLVTCTSWVLFLEVPLLPTAAAHPPSAEAGCRDMAAVCLRDGPKKVH